MAIIVNAIISNIRFCIGSGLYKVRCGSDLEILVYLRLRIGTNNKTCFGPVQGQLRVITG